ncbi:kinase-like domain-containing protein [Rhizophagus diaphanus]|nr:kinase-like domain-containing protein [Rhizophagus diaphanus] [Rhizophagus sp. MUCL 43196]
MAQSNDKVSSSTKEFEVKKFEEIDLNNLKNGKLGRRRRGISMSLSLRRISKFQESESVILNEFISEKGLKWVPYNKFNNVEYLDKGGFGTIYKAIWKDKNKVVVLKSLNNMNENENSNDFINEWKYHQGLDSYHFIKLYGFTKDPDTSDYMVIMDYANQGNLRGNLTRVVKYNWNQKLHKIYEIIFGLNQIHKQNLIHCDLHDGNILRHDDYWDKFCISDLGLCRPVKSFFKKDDIYGIIPFMAPEVLRGKPCTLASDIYSFSMIMWEFTSGVPPFNDREHDLQLSISICKGERPEITENTPQCYVDLMKKCWDEDPLKRPSSQEVLNTIKKCQSRANYIWMSPFGANLYKIYLLGENHLNE